MADAAPLHGRRGHGRDAQPSAHHRDPATATQARLSRGRTKPSSKFHHLDGRYLAKDWLGTARRRRPGPVDYRHLGLDERHGMYLTATLLVGSLDLLLQGRPQHAHLKAELDLLRRR